MSRGRKPIKNNTLNTWESVFWKNISTYINMLNNHLAIKGVDLIEVGNILEKLSFKIPKGLNSKEILQNGDFPVISQSKEFIIGYSDQVDLLVKEKLPLIIFGDHSKTIKYITTPFIIGADGVKILKPRSEYNEKFFFYFLHGVITDTKDYGRHYSLLKKGYIANVKDLKTQKSIVEFLDNLRKNNITGNNVFFNKEIEYEIISLHKNYLKELDISNELLHQINLIKQLRQVFLREAMQGQFVFPKQPLQDGKLETGADLLEKIKAEKAQLIKDKKIKKEKELPPISEDEIPFEIPENWAWCNFGNFSTLINGDRGKNYPNRDEYVENGIPWINTGHIEPNGTLSSTTMNFITREKFETLRSGNIQKGDLVYCLRGATFGKTAFVEPYSEGSIASSLMIIRLSSLVNNKFVYNYLKSDFAKTQLMRFNNGSAQPNLAANDVNRYYFPMPPLHEQQQIVDKLEELMTFCDDLEESIKESQGYNEILLQEVLREALQGEVI